VSARLFEMSLARSAAETPDPSGPCQCEACLDTGEAVTGSYCFCRAGEDAEVADDKEVVTVAGYVGERQVVSITVDEQPREIQALTVAEFAEIMQRIYHARRTR